MLAKKTLNIQMEKKKLTRSYSVAWELLQHFSGIHQKNRSHKILVECNEIFCDDVVNLATFYFLVAQPAC